MTTETKQVDFSSLEVLARLTDTKILAKEICDKWLLITYDLPKTKEGNQARNRFLSRARALGATKHTESVYLMPWTGEAEAMALSLAAAGQAVVWSSQTTNPQEATRITENYDKQMLPQIEALSERLNKIEDHWRNNHKKRLERMMDKTAKIIANLEAAIIRRGSAELYFLLLLQKRRIQSMGV